MKWRGLLSLVAAAAFSVACNNARDTAADRTDDPAAVGTSGDARIDEPGATTDETAGDVQHFVNEAAIAGMTEVQLGELAAERGVNREVKQFGQMMVKDHTRVGDELKKTVAAHTVQLPTALDDKHRDLVEKLRGMKGTDFDREYMAAMVDGHEQVKDLLEGRARRADSRNANTTAAPGASADRNQQLEVAVNQWAAKTLPGVEQHLERAKAIKEQLDDVRN